MSIQSGVSTPFETSNFEVLQPGEGYDLPPGSIELSEQITETAALAAEEHGRLLRNNANLDIDDQRRDIMTEPVWGAKLLENLVVSGHITEEESRVLLKGSPKISKLLHQEFKEAEGLSELTELMSRFSQVDQIPGQTIRKAVPAEYRKEITVFMNIVNRGRQLLDFGRVTHAVDELSRLTGELRSTPDEKVRIQLASELDDDRASVSILETLWAMDCAMHAASTPMKAVPYNSLDASPEERDFRKAVFLRTATESLLKARRNEEYERLDEVLKVAQYTFYDQTKTKNLFDYIKKEFKPHYKQTQNLINMGLLIGKFEAYQNYINALQHLDPVIQLEESSESFMILEQRMSELMTDLYGSTQTFLESTPSADRMLGALVIERWLCTTEDGFLELVGELASKNQGLEPEKRMLLHEEIWRFEREQQQARATELEAFMEETEKRYEITSDKIRSLANGLKLRRKLEEWSDPGSQHQVFQRDKAQQLAGLALDTSFFPNLAEDFRQLESAWVELKQIDPKSKRNGLLSTVDTLREIAEAASQKQLQDKELAPIWDLLKYINTTGTVDDYEAPDTDDDVNNIDDEFPYFESLRAFPPGTTEIVITDIIDDFKDILGGNPHKFAIEWERIYSLIKLHAQLSERGYPVAAMRLSASNWHPLPHYALEVKGKGDNGRVVSVIESPVYGNATYVIPQAEWREIAEFSKQDARDLGAKPRVHTEGKTSDDHRAKLLADIISSLSSVF